MRCVIYEARFCLESLKGGGCGLDGTCPVAGIERAPSCLTSGCPKSSEWHSGPNYGPRHLFSFSSISLYYAKLQSNQTIHHFKNPLHFLTYAILFISIFSHEGTPSPSNKILLFLEIQANCHLCCDAPHDLMSLLPELLSHFVLPVPEHSPNSLRIGRVPYV